MNLLLMIIAVALPILGMGLLIWPCLLLAAHADAATPPFPGTDLNGKNPADEIICGI